MVVFLLFLFYHWSFSKCIDETIDTTVLKVKSEGKLHVLSRASWGDCGGEMVDNTFKQMLIDIVGEEFMDSFRQNNTADYNDIFSAFKRKKRKIWWIFYESKDKFANFIMLFRKIQKRYWYRCLKRTLDTRYAKLLKWSGDKMRIDIDLYQSFFDPVNEKIVHCIREILSKP